MIRSTPRIPHLLACAALALLALAPAPAHAEVGGHVDVDLELGVPTASFSSSGFSPGVALDFALLRHFTFGAQLGYNMVAAWHTGLEVTSAGVAPIPPIVQRWVNLGLHAGVAF